MASQKQNERSSGKYLPETIALGVKALEDVSGLAEHELPTYRDQFEKDVEAVLDAVGYDRLVDRKESAEVNESVVQCPYCGAEPGLGCVNGLTGTPYKRNIFHSSRTMAFHRLKGEK